MKDGHCTLIMMRQWQMFSAKACWNALGTSAVSYSPHRQCQTCSRGDAALSRKMFAGSSFSASKLNRGPLAGWLADWRAGNPICQAFSWQDRRQSARWRSIIAQSSLGGPVVHCFAYPLYTCQVVFHPCWANSIGAITGSRTLAANITLHIASDPLPGHMIDRLLHSGTIGGSQHSSWT